MGSAWAQESELSQVALRSEYETTSDELNRSSTYLNWRNHRRDALWAYESEAETATDFGINTEFHNGGAPGLNFASQKVSVLYGSKFSSRLSVDVEAGMHSASGSGRALAKSFFASGVRLAWQIAENLQFVLPAKNDLYYHRSLPSGPAEGLSGIQLDPLVIYRPHERIRLLSRNQYYWLSDGNRKKENDLSVLYGLSTTEVWIWLGLGIDYLEFSKTTPAYWSPQRYYAWGPRIEAVFPLIGAFSFSGSLSLNTFQENDFQWGSGHYSSVALRYGNRNDFLADVQMVQIRSTQGGTAWTSNQVGASLLWSY